MIENCIELIVLAFYSHSKTIAKMKIDEDVLTTIDFLNQLSAGCRVKGESEVSILPLKKLKRGLCIELEQASASLAYLLMGVCLTFNVAVKINRLTSQVDEKQLEAFSKTLENTFVYSLNKNGIVFSCFSTVENASFAEIQNDSLCAGVVLSAPLKADESAVTLGENEFCRYTALSLKKLKLFGINAQKQENVFYFSSVYESRFPEKENKL